MRKIVTKDVEATGSTYVGKPNEVWLDEATNQVRIGDGSTAGGLAITTEGGVEYPPGFDITGSGPNTITANGLTVNMASTSRSIALNSGSGSFGNITLTGGGEFNMQLSRMRLSNLPTGTSGLSSGDVWVDQSAGGVLKRVS